MADKDGVTDEEFMVAVSEKLCGELDEDQMERFIELTCSPAPFETFEEQRDPNFKPDPHACPACKKRGKNWYGADPNCAFLNGVFDADNWNCATMNLLRDLYDEGHPRVHHAWSDDQNCLMFPLEGEFLILSWYKHRGRTEGAWIVGSDKIRTLTLEEAEQIIELHAEKGASS